MTPTLFKSLRKIKNAVETLIREDITNGRTPQDTVNTIISDMDVDTIKWFFAETIKAADWDGRYSKKAKEWAAQLYIPILHNENGERHGQIDAHPAHINQIAEKLITA